MTLECRVIAAKASLPPSGKMILYTEIVFRSDVSLFSLQSNYGHLMNNKYGGMDSEWSKFEMMLISRATLDVVI